MLRINLLPAYVAQRRVTRMLLAVYGAVLAILVVGLGGWYSVLVPEDAHWTDWANRAATAAANVASVNSQASTVTSSIAPIQANLDFVNDVHAYNLAYIKLYQTVATYTSPKILYHSMDVTGTNLTISGYTPSLGDLGRYLLEMYKEPDATDVALTTPIPGYGAADPDTPTTETIPAPAVGKLPGYPLPVHSYTVYQGKIVAVNTGQAGFGGAPPAFGGRQGFGPPQGFGGIPAGFNAGGNLNTKGLFDPRHDGFPFTVVLALKSAPAPPSPPTTPTVITIGGGGGAGQFQGGGGFGGFRGGPGGPPPGFRGGPGGPPPGYIP